ncbi:MAG: L-2-hydroxyglutarate oxidase [Bacteroidetes bacterium]|jgi:L-2-hydroxyglutarate oxidase|nr:L-2-hydroxyglutarate oxidase [Bacteroidota bacterium]MDA0930067.1 L-2-hydroxyglutarate oxidase [Bacteroidota bacterium]
METTFDVAIVGGGIVGAATAYRLQQAYPHLRLVLLEKMPALADHQTGNNSGVIHSGIYYKPGSLKAKNCVQGRRELVEFAKENRIAHDVCGKIIVATDTEELSRLDGIYNRGIENGIEGISKIGPDEIREIEPHCRGLAAVRVSCTGIIDFRGATETMAKRVTDIQPQSVIQLNTEVKEIRQDGNIQILETNQGRFLTRYTVYCAGLQSDRLAKKDRLKPQMRIVGFRGDYYELAPHAEHKVKHLIYPVPNPAFPFLGVHFTRMALGGVECGPNAVFTFKREGYGKTDFNLADSLDALSYSGTWRLFANHWKFGLDEYRRAFSKRRFLKTLQRLIPDLTLTDLAPGRAGVRAMALGPDGEMLDDFVLAYGHNSIHVLNAPSPAATAALAIGSQIRDMAKERFHFS